MDQVSAGRAQRFWGQFGHTTRTACQSFANAMQRSDADVIMFTARKAACFCDSLRLAYAWTPHADTCSDKALEFDTEWLRGRRLLLVDDVVATGATADRLLSTLRGLGLAELSFLPLATRREWPASLAALRRRHGDVRFVAPPAVPESGADIGEEIVRSIAALPRPYNLDWPLLSGWRLKASQLDSVIVQSGWEAQEVSSPFQLQLGVRVVTLEPNIHDLQAILPGLDAPNSILALIKIRLYAEPVTEGAYHISLVPLVAFDRLNYADLSFLYASLGVEASPRDSDRGAARVAQYVAALLMARAFESNLRSTMKLGELTESQWQLALAFGPSVARQPQAQVASAGEAHPPEHLRRETLSLRQAVDREAETHYARFQLASFLWAASNQSARRRARDGVAGATADDLITFLDKTYEHEAFSVSQLIQVLEANGLHTGSAILVSGFLDEAIDNGLTVPSMREAPDSYERVFRAGETIDFSMREQRLFSVMLEELLNRSHGLTFGKILVEKVLVLAIRFGAQRPPLLKPVFVPAGSSVLTIAYSRHGPIATNDPRATELPIASSDTHTLGHELEHLGLIEWQTDTSRRRGDRFALTMGPVRLEPTSSVIEVPFRRIGGLVAQILQRGLVSRSDFELFVVLCNGDQVPLALAAELHRMMDGLGNLKGAISRYPATAKGIKVLLRRSQDWLISLESGLEKLEGIAREVVSRVDDRVRSGLDHDALMNWEELTAAVMTPASHAEVAELTSSLGLWLIHAAQTAGHATLTYGPARTRQTSNAMLARALHLARRLDCTEAANQYAVRLGALEAGDVDGWGRAISSLREEAERLWEEVSAGQDRSALHRPAERYVQALLLVSDDTFSEEARAAILDSRDRLAPHQLEGVHPLPPHIVGDNVAGFAVRDVSVREVAAQLMPYIDTRPELRMCTVLMVTHLGITRRLLRRPFNTYWYGAGFSRMCAELPRTLARLGRPRLMAVENTIP